MEMAFASLSEKEEKKWYQSPFFETLKGLYTGKWRWFVISFSAILFLYLVYFAFSFKTSPTYADRSLYWSDPRMIALRVFSGVLLLALASLFLYWLAKKRLSVKKAAVLIALGAGIIIMTYSFSTPIYDYNGNWNQHDVYYGSTVGWYTNPNTGVTDCGSGHMGMIFTIFRLNQYPEIKLNAAGEYDFSFSALLERYQPKLFYYVSAYYMHFNSLFIHCGTDLVSIQTSSGGSTAFGLTNTEWALYESLRILYVMMEWAQLYFIYKIFQKIHLQGKGLLLAFALTSFVPIWCYFANWTNNDGMSCFFAIMGLYYALCFLQERKWYQMILTAIGIGFSMAAKLGGALIAIVIAPLLIYGLVDSILLDKKGEKKFSKNLPEWGRYLLQMVVFAIIVFPLGLFFPIYNLVKFGQPLTFFSVVPNTKLYIVNESFFQRFLLYPNYDVFKMIWVYHSNASETYVQDTSTITALIKTSLYGEYGFGLSEIQCGILYISANLIIALMMLLSIYRIVALFLERQPIDKLRLYVLLGVILIFYGWQIWFVHQNPYTCNQDMRYIAPILIGLGGYVGSTYERLEKSKYRWLQVGGTKALIALGAIFVFAVCLTYLSLTAWYYRG